MGKDLNAMSRDELLEAKKTLQKEMRAVEKALETLKDRQKKAALDAAEKAAAEHGFSLAELGTVGAKTRKPKSAGVAKYRNPADASQTWTGKGRRPDWIRAAIESGKDLSAFAI